MRSLRPSSRLVLVTVCLTWMSAATGATPEPQDLASRIDAIMESFASDQPGAAVIVVKDGRALVRKDYGLANLETQTPMRPEMVFEIRIDHEAVHIYRDPHACRAGKTGVGGRRSEVRS